MQKLSGLDASFLYFETSSQLNSVCGIITLDPSTMPGGYDFEKLKAALESRISGVPEFRRKLHHVPLHLDHPIWVDDPDFDVDHHLHRIGCPSPGGPRELSEICAHIAGQRLDRDRPLWEMWVIDGVDDGKVAVMTKMHHATVDGVSGANLLAHLCSLEADAAPLASSSDPTRLAPPNDVELVGRALFSLARRPLALAKLLGPVAEVVPEWVRRAREGRAMPAPFTAPRTSFNGTITGHRSVAFGEFSLDDVKDVKKAVGGTVNDVVLAVCAGALRGYLQARNELPDSPLIAMVPVSVHGKSGRDDGSNKVTGMFASLPTDVDDPLERLSRIAADNTHAKEHVNAIDADMLQDWARFAAPRTFGLAVRVYSGLRLPERHPPVYNLVVSNVPGPPVPLYFLGARIEALYPLGPVFHGVGLNITVMSNENRLNVGLIACRELVPSDAIWALSEAMPKAMAELLEAARGTRGGEESPRLSARRRSEVLQEAALRTGTGRAAAKQPTKRAAAKRTTAKRTTAKKSTAKKSTAKKSTAKKSTDKKTAATRAPGKKTAAKKSTSSKSAPRAAGQ